MAILFKNMKLGSPIYLSSWRKIAIGTWRTAKDPSVYGMIDFDAEPILKYIEKVKNETDVKITVTHIVGKAIALVLQKHPEVNCVLRWGRLYPRKNVDVFFQVASDMEGQDLSGMTIRSADLKSVSEIAQEMQEHVHKIRHKGDPSFKKMKKTLGLIPGLMIGCVLDLAEFLMYSLNLWSPLLGSPQDSFGSVMVTSIGSLGIETGFVPLVPYSRVPLLLAVGTVRPMPVVKEGRVEVADQLRICCTFDHRLIDGVVASHMIKTLTKIFANPEIEFNQAPVSNKFLK